MKTIEISDELYDYLFKKCNKEIEDFERKKAVWDSKSSGNKELLSPEEYEEQIRQFDGQIKQLELLLALKKAENQTDGSKINTSNKLQPVTFEPISGNIEHLEPVMQITNHAISRKLPNGTVIRLRFRKKNYETQINSSNYKYITLNSIFRKKFQASVNIWRENIYFKDEKGWLHLKSLQEN